jgi:hypothetical protein
MMITMLMKQPFKMMLPLHQQLSYPIRQLALHRQRHQLQFIMLLIRIRRRDLLVLLFRVYQSPLWFIQLIHSKVCTHFYCLLYVVLVTSYMSMCNSASYPGDQQIFNVIVRISISQHSINSRINYSFCDIYQGTL